MPNRRPIIAGAAVLLLLLLTVTTVAVINAPPTEGDPVTGVCSDQLHFFASDPGKISAHSFGPPIVQPDNIDAVDQQAVSSTCVDPTVAQSMLWASHAPTGPANVDEINQRIAWSVEDDGYRKDAAADVVGWVFAPEAKRQIVQIPQGSCYWTLASAPVDGRYAVYQTQVCLGAAEAFWQVAAPDGNMSLFKLSCHLQPAKLTPFNGVPTKPPTHLPPAGKPPRVPTTTPPTSPPGGGTRPPHTTQPPRTTAPPHTSPPTTRPCTDNNHDGKCDTHVVGRPLPGGAGGPQTPDSDSTPDTQDPDGTHHGSDPGTGCHGTCTGGTPTTTRPAPPSTVQPTPTTVPATTAPTVPPPP